MKASFTIGMNECCLNTHMFDRVGFFPSTFGDHAAKDEAQLFFFFFGILGFAGKKIMSHR